MQEKPNLKSFTEKVHFFSYDYLKCCLYISTFNSSNKYFTKKLYLKLISTSQLIEDFLDFHGAKNNTDWFYYRELSAAIRHLSMSGYSQQHIANRLSFYDLTDTDIFKQESKLTQNFINNALIKLAPDILSEAKRLKILIPKNSFSSSDFPEVETNKLLKFDIDDEYKDIQKKNIVKIASQFLNITKDIEYLRFYEPYSINDINSIVPDKINEVEIRRFEMLLHNLQSSFDTYVIHGGYRFGNRKLKQLRGLFSLVFHLLQTVGRFLHFYERHLFKTGYKNIYKQVRGKLALLIDPNALLDRTINYGLYFACHYISFGKNIAHEILNEYIERTSILVTIPITRGFHSRPSLLVAKVVQHYGGQVELCIENDRFDASNVLDIQWAGGLIQNKKLAKVTFEGDSRALKDIELLAKVNYGEDTMGKGIKLPKELNYLN